MNKKQITILVVVIIVFVAIYFLFFKDKDQSKKESGFNSMKKTKSENIGIPNPSAMLVCGTDCTLTDSKTDCNQCATDWGTNPVSYKTCVCSGGKVRPKIQLG